VEGLEERMKEKVKQILSHRKRRSIASKDLIAAAVLVPLYEKWGEYYLLFTKRTERVSSHKGQISFPGGTCQGNEAPQTTALRESWEETGLRPEDVEILGELDDTETLSTGYIISPFVGIIPYPYQFRLSEEEVEEIIEVPISALRDKRNYKEETQFYQGKTYLACTYEYNNHIIWGATARIVRHFLDVVFRKGEV
jgi:8-oxo-dGTP pyrophosphatase MutT (NUDIX family)